MEMVLACRNHPDAVEGLRYCSRCGQTFCPDCLVTIRGNTFCASCKAEQMRDLASGVDQSALELAGIGRRFGALFIDSLILSIPIIIVMVSVIAVTVSGKSNFNPIWVQPAALVAVGLYVVYEGLMLASRGQTLGKMAMKIKVVRVDGTAISTGQAWGRAFMRQILASCLSIFNYLPAFFTKDRTCLHDLVASTRVVNWS
ncbi:MAG TPA: RDD family protein [Thermoanaerobaculia bacterium]|nr:RDD family protein [Thermoanaerobaculia bacterium]